MAAYTLLLPRLISRNVGTVSRLGCGVISRVSLQRCTIAVPTVQLATSSHKYKKDWCEVTYERADGVTFTVQGKEGDNLLDIAINNDLDLEGFGACEGTLACSTCHLVFKQSDFDNIKDPCTDEEMDMLDLAYGLSDTSRLGCQVCLTKEMSGLRVKVPEGTADARTM